MRKLLPVLLTVLLLAGISCSSSSSDKSSLVSGASAASTVPTSIKAGLWSDPAVWSTGHIPTSTETVTVAHAVTYDQADSQISGLTVSPTGTFMFATDRTAILRTDKNVIVQGILRMRPAAPNFTNLLQFVNVDEQVFVGGGMDPLASDVGLWVMGAGQLDLVGAPRTAWTRTLGSVAAGATNIALGGTQTGWRVGDNIAISPTAPGDTTGFDGAYITGINGSTITLDRAVPHAHPAVNGRWTAEVMNLTRNVRIEGTGDGGLSPATNHRTHIFIRSTRPQTIKWVQVRHVGPRPDYVRKTRPVGAEPKWPSAMETFGRYGLHFHMNGDSSRTSIVEGVVVRDAGNHAYVPHLSNGITFRDTISYNTTNDAYWWDGARLPPPGTLATWHTYEQKPDPSEGILYDHALAAKVREGGNSIRIAGFELGLGAGNTIRNSTAVGVIAGTGSGGYEWPEAAVSVWKYTDNLAHNNAADGIFVWQNTDKDHVVTNFDGYYNNVGIEHGAYSNHYTYQGGNLYGNTRAGIMLHSVSADHVPPLRFLGITIDGGTSAVETVGHNLQNPTPTVLDGITFRATTQGLLLRTSGSNRDVIDILNPTFVGKEFYRLVTPNGSIVRVQQGTTAYKVTPINPGGGTFIPAWNAWKTPIAPFS